MRSGHRPVWQMPDSSRAAGLHNVDARVRHNAQAGTFNSPGRARCCFPTAHLASYAGLAPATKSSGTSIHGEHTPRGGDRRLKRAMFLSAFAALHDPASRTYYNRCRARGKTHSQALLRLARHRIRVLFAMLRDGTFYEPRAPETAPA
jgi:transposase